jgi:hypothetical protein
MTFLKGDAQRLNVEKEMLEAVQKEARQDNIS